MGFKRQAHSAVIFHNVLTQKHRRQIRIRLAGAILTAFEQRQVFAPADAIQTSRSPQRVAAIEPKRAETVEIGQAFDFARRQAAAQPYITHRVIARTAFRHELKHSLFAQTLRLPET